MIDADPQPDKLSELPYFEPLLPWQKRAWRQLTEQFYAGKLPHGLLASGMAGIGKHAFVWRVVAWLLCTAKEVDGACGRCDSCTWLVAGTHPDLLILPTPSVGDKDVVTSIKIDDVRALQDYSHVKGRGLRLIVLDHAETMTLGAANALLKTLEEPRDGVHLLLISDHPARLLPTIKSRVQNLPLSHIDASVALGYLHSHLPFEYRSQAQMLLNLADGAVLSAQILPTQPWFGQRELWLKTWMALRRGTRHPMAASDYWQSVLSFADFMILTRLMLVDVIRVTLGLGSLHEDVAMVDIIADTPLSLTSIQAFIDTLDDMMVAVGQNVQDKLAYDALMNALVKL